MALLIDGGTANGQHSGCFSSLPVPNKQPSPRLLSTWSAHAPLCGRGGTVGDRRRPGGGGQ